MNYFVQLSFSDLKCNPFKGMVCSLKDVHVCVIK